MPQLKRTTNADMVTLISKMLNTKCISTCLVSVLPVEHDDCVVKLDKCHGFVPCAWTDLTAAKEVTPTRMEPVACPYCGYMLDCVDSPDNPGAPSSPFDFSCCINCGEVLRFDKDLKLIKAERGDLVLLSVDDPDGYRELVRIREAIRTVNERRRK